MSSLLVSQLSYCPLIWIFHSQAIEHRINRIHERILRLICPNQHQLTFKELLEKTRPSAYTREIYKINKISPEVVNPLCGFTNQNYSLTNASILKRKRYLTVYYESESLASLAPKIWELVPDSIREVKTSIFKNNVKAWTTDKCPCRLRKTYIGQVGFI